MCFKDAEKAKVALDKLNGKKLGEQTLYVSQALNKTQREQQIKRRSEAFKNSMAKMNIFAKNFGTDTSEEQLRDYFAQFGEIKNVKIM